MTFLEMVQLMISFYNRNQPSQTLKKSIIHLVDLTGKMIKRTINKELRHKTRLKRLRLVAVGNLMKNNPWLVDSK